MEEKKMTLEEAQARISELEAELAASKESAGYSERLYQMYRDEAESYKNILCAVKNITSLVRIK